MSKVSLDPQVERGLVEAAQADIEHFAPLYTHYHPHLLRFVLSKVSHQELAEDLTAQAFAKAMENIDKFSWQGVSFSAWLYQIAKRLIIDHFRKAKNRETGDSEVTELMADASSVELQVESEVQGELLRKLIATLPDKERQVVQLKFFRGYSNKVIAELTGLSESNVGTVVYRTVAELRVRLDVKT